MALVWGSDIKNTLLCLFENTLDALTSLQGEQTTKKRTEHAQEAHKKRTALPYSSSSIQTILLVPEFHRVSGYRRYPVADFTASGELHPALKTKYSVVSCDVLYDRPPEKATPNFSVSPLQIETNVLY